MSTVRVRPETTDTFPDECVSVVTLAFDRNVVLLATVRFGSTCPLNVKSTAPKVVNVAPEVVIGPPMFMPVSVIADEPKLTVTPLDVERLIV